MFLRNHIWEPPDNECIFYNFLLLPPTMYQHICTYLPISGSTTTIRSKETFAV